MNQEIIARLEHSFRSESASKPFLSFDKDTSHLVIGDAEERKRLAQIAAKAVFDALGQSLDQDDDEKSTLGCFLITITTKSTRSTMLHPPLILLSIQMLDSQESNYYHFAVQ